MQTLDDLTKLGRRVYDAGFTGLKTNMITFDNEGEIGRYAPGFAGARGWPDLNLPSGLIGELRNQLIAMAEDGGRRGQGQKLV